MEGYAKFILEKAGYDYNYQLTEEHIESLLNEMKQMVLERARKQFKDNPTEFNKWLESNTK